MQKVSKKGMEPNGSAKNDLTVMVEGHLFLKDLKLSQHIVYCNAHCGLSTVDKTLNFHQTLLNLDGQDLRLWWPSTEWETGPAQNPGKMGTKMENRPRPEMAEKWPPMEKHWRKNESPIASVQSARRRDAERNAQSFVTKYVFWTTNQPELMFP